jgi:hypothetical protein
MLLISIIFNFDVVVLEVIRLCLLELARTPKLIELVDVLYCPFIDGTDDSGLGVIFPFEEQVGHLFSKVVQDVVVVISVRSDWANRVGSC